MEIAWEISATDLSFPEGPAWDGKGSVYCSNCNSDHVTRVGPDGSVSTAWHADPSALTWTFHKTNGMTFFEDGSLFACDFDRNAIVRLWPDGSQECFASGSGARPFEGPNDLAFAPSGDLYFTAPTGSGRDRPTGPIYRVSRDGRAVRVAEGMAFPNGLAFAADGARLYVCESQMNRILVFGVCRDGSLDGPTVFADLAPAGAGEPDGMAVDANGRLWIAHYGAHAVLVVRPDGAIEHRIPMPPAGEGGPTNVEFGGPDMRTLWVTDPAAGVLYRTRVDVPGLALFHAPPNDAA